MAGFASRPIGTPTGGQFDFDATYIHGVRHAEGAPAVSLHCYSPALWRMGHYEPDPNGVLRRVSMTYADELLGRRLRRSRIGWPDSPRAIPPRSSGRLAVSGL